MTTTLNSKPASERRMSVLGWALGGAAVLAALVALAVALWPASEAEKAREDGEQLGSAVAQLYEAQSTAEVDAALTEVRDAGRDAAEHGGNAVAQQVADQEDALARAVDGFVGSRTTEDAFEAELYQAELEVAVDDLIDQAEEFQTNAPEVGQAFWEGVEEGFDEGVSGS
jgi:hypothetical protein